MQRPGHEPRRDAFRTPPHKYRAREAVTHAPRIVTSEAVSDFWGSAGSIAGIRWVDAHAARRASRGSSNRVRTLALLAATTLLSTGCAFANVDVHPPDTPPALAAEARGGPGRGREIIVYAPFADARYEITRCGMQKNGYNMDTADVKCTEPPGRWVADALAIELHRAGYKPLRADAVPGPTTIVVRGTVYQLFLEPKHDFFTLTVEGDVSARLVVSTASGLLAERAFYVKGMETGLASTEATFQASADKATRHIARAMVVALTQLLERYPDLGAPSASAPVAGAAGGIR